MKLTVELLKADEIAFKGSKTRFEQICGVKLTDAQVIILLLAEGGKVDQKSTRGKLFYIITQKDVQISGLLEKVNDLGKSVKDQLQFSVNREHEMQTLRDQIVKLRDERDAYKRTLISEGYKLE